MLNEVLHSLSQGKHQILLREGTEATTFQKGETLTFNSNFSSRLYRIRLNSYGCRENISIKTATTTIPAEDRQHQIDAAIVRILKAAKRMTIKDVLKAVNEALGLTLNPADIEKRIESLIERDFVTKDENDLSYLIYVP